MSIRAGGRNGFKKRFRKQTQTALFKRKKVCRFSGKNPEVVDYKNIDLLKDFVSETGKIGNKAFFFKSLVSHFLNFKSWIKLNCDIIYSEEHLKPNSSCF